MTQNHGFFMLKPYMYNLKQLPFIQIILIIIFCITIIYIDGKNCL